MITLEQAKKRYPKIPERLLTGLYGYVEYRQATGHFLNAVLSNHLFEAIGRADSESLAALPVLVSFIHEEMRSDCYGSPEKIHDWLFPKPPPIPSRHD